MWNSRLAVALLTLAWSASARAAVPCKDLAQNVLYVTTDDSSLRLVREAAWKLIRELLSKPMLEPPVIVYQVLPGCAAVRTVVPVAACGDGTCMKGDAKFFPFDLGDWSPSDISKVYNFEAKDCSLPMEGVSAHVALSEVAATSCPVFAASPPSGVVDLSGSTGPLGAVSPLALVTSVQSAQRSIQAGEAYFIYGKGKDANVSPWVDESVQVKRDPRSALAVLFGLRLGLEPSRFRGSLPACNEGGLCVSESDRVISKLGAGDAGLAFMPTAEVERNLSDVKPLAFQALGQRGAFYPDRTYDKKMTSKDKRNVREGRYPLWGHLHVIAKADSNDPKKPIAVAQRLVEILQGGGAAVDGEDALVPLVRNGYVPQCAMSVNRSSDRAALAPYAPPAPCGCWFEATATKSTNNRCTICTDKSQCGTGECRLGFCEAR